MKAPLIFSILILSFLSCRKDNDTPPSTSQDTVSKPVPIPIPVPPTFDKDPSEAPRFMRVNYIELDSILKISKFRSGIGHDYSDGFESCRSMKHYYQPKVKDWKTVKIFAPADGKIVNIQPDWIGTQVHIQSSEYPAFTFVIFHVTLDSTLKTDAVLKAGQRIGSHCGNQTTSDIALMATTSLKHVTTSNGPSGVRLISIFNVMTDSLFSAYVQKGVSVRDSMIITKSQRDADPLNCNGEYFSNEGKISNWIILK